MHSWIQFITTPTADTPGTGLLLHFDQKRYLIGNIHEGINRATIEMGMKMGKVSEIFMTGKTEWKTTGGLLGLVLTLADVIAAAPPEKNRDKEKITDPGLTIHGGRNILHTLAASRRFTFRKGVPLKIKEYSDKKPSQEKVQDWKPDWADDNIQVWAMSIAPSEGRNITSDSPRKRSFEEFAEEKPSPSVGIKRTDSVEDFIDPDQAIRENVVREMFGSNWQRDSLDEVLLADVVMPAHIFIRNEDTKKIERYYGPLPDGTQPTPNIRVLVRRPWPAVLQEYLPPTQPSHNALSYVIRCRWQRGKFLPERAKALNVPPGPLWAKLAQGIDVQSKDGKTVKPGMVLAEGRNGGGVVVADLPSQDYIHGLLDRPEWRTMEVMTGVEAVIWLLGPGVSQNKDLQSFINDQKHLKHIISSPDHCPNYLAFGASASATIRLNRIDPLRYGVPFHDNVSLRHKGQQSIENASIFDYTPAERGLKIQLLPAVHIGNEQIVPPLDIAAVVKDISPDVLDLAESARKEISGSLRAATADQNLPSPDAEIICLGTGSAMPSKYRNVSATLLRLPGSGSYLFDCGENTLGQLKRVFPPEKLCEVLRDLKVIWISHLHADHHLGTTAVINAWYEEVYGKNYQPGRPLTDSLMRELMGQASMLRNEKRLFVVSQQRMLDWLREYSSAEDFGYERLVPVASIPANYKYPRSSLEWNGKTISLDNSDDPLGNAFKFATGLTDLVTCSVAHCVGAQAVSMTFPTGFKFSYSGDCRPSKTFVDIGRGSTVLLHEATFDDELQGDAEAKKHCTTSEALAVGKAMGVRRIILTHFSQRYSKIPVMGSVDGLKVRLEVDEVTDDLAVELDQAEISAGGSASSLPEESHHSQHAQPPPSTSEAIDSPTKSLPKKQNPMESLVSDSTPVDDIKVGVAFDYMRVKVAEIMHLEKFTPALLKLLEQAEPDQASLDISNIEETRKPPKTRSKRN